MNRPYVIRRPVANAYLVRQRDRRLRRELIAVVAAVLVAGGGLLAYTWVHVEILRVGYRIDGLEKELHRLLEHERRRRLELAHLTQPERVERRARAELGMQAPSLEQTIFLAQSEAER